MRTKSHRKKTSFSIRANFPAYARCRGRLGRVVQIYLSSALQGDLSAFEINGNRIEFDITYAPEESPTLRVEAALRTVEANLFFTHAYLFSRGETLFI